MIEYRGELIEKAGEGFVWEQMLWTDWAALTRFIDQCKRAGVV